METKHLSGQPGGLSTLLRAALPVVPGVNQLPGVKKASAQGFAGLSYDRTGVEASRTDVDAYAAVCGFPRKDTVPLPYPHMLAFPLHMAIMSDPAFPYPAIGMVHLENSITARRAIAVGEVLDLTTSVAAPRAHAKGALLDFVTTVTSGGEVVWESTSTYLRRGGKPEGEPDAGLVIADAPTGGLQWRLPADLGRSYASVSGDHNPIHLYPLTAKALGFPRQIAHGMWTKARSIAAIENRLPEAVTVEVAFKKPVFLPGTVAFAERSHDGEHTFALTNPKDGSPHLVGRATPA
ncbi:MaoC family dehydratase [Nocardioides allogilvus]|uniref:MaoC family dehydratase n=1 Tax=Nocardioides allogilvus TaxID=2072017 RepID=UPI000D30BD08|nr:MaoC/PaaZ C-terminal domain-containing protein [Nocardioides allogilvus]